MAERKALSSPDRPTLAGVRPVDSSTRLRAGAHILPSNAPKTAQHDQGHITSVCFSPYCASWIGLALIRNGAARRGEIMRAYDPLRGGDVAVLICDPVFVDPEGARLRV
jgi:sarcosine oxidase subunit alpha